MTAPAAALERTRVRIRARLVVLGVVATVGLGVAVPASAADASISGLVTAEDTGRPVAGICVVAEDIASGEPSTTKTNSDGRYRVAGLAAGEYTVTFDSCVDPPNNEYATEHWPGRGSLGYGDRIPLAPEDQRTGIDASLKRYGFIEGMVTDVRTGEPVERACVSATSPDGFNGHAQTGGEGRPAGKYRFRAPSNDAYAVNFLDCSPEPIYLTEFFDDAHVTTTWQEAVTRSTPVEVLADRTTTVSVTLDPGGSISGTVTDAHTGEPLEKFCVGVWPVGAGPALAPMEAVFRAEEWSYPWPEPPLGTYRIGRLPAGEYTVSFGYCWPNDHWPGSQNGRSYQPQWFEASPSRQAATRVTVVAGRDTGSVDAAMDASEEGPWDACPAFAVPEDGFADVPPDNVHEYAIDCMAWSGAGPVVRGTAADRYEPNRYVRRDHLAGALAQAIDTAWESLPQRPRDHFDDDDGNVFERAINQLAEAGIVQGTGPRRYSPAATVSRAEMASYLVRTYVKFVGTRPTPTRDHFDDDDGTTHEGNINVAAELGLAHGTGTTTFSPDGRVRRDQMASFLRRLLERIVNDRRR